MPTWSWLLLIMGVHGNFCLKFYDFLYHYLLLFLKEQITIFVRDSGRIFGWEIIFFKKMFPCLHNLSSLHNTPIKHYCIQQGSSMPFFLANGSSMSLNFLFLKNLNDRMLKILQPFLFILEINNFFPYLKGKIWTTNLSGLYSCNSFFHILTNSPNKKRFVLDKAICLDCDTK